MPLEKPEKTQAGVANKSIAVPTYTWDVALSLSAEKFQVINDPNGQRLQILTASPDSPDTHQEHTIAHLPANTVPLLLKFVPSDVEPSRCETSEEEDWKPTQLISTQRGSAEFDAKPQAYDAVMLLKTANQTFLTVR